MQTRRQSKWVRRRGARIRCRSRYRGLTKTSLQHQLTGTPRARTRTSHFAALCPAELTLGGVQAGAE